jgi:predicted peptidase
MEWHSLLTKEQFRSGDNVLPYRLMSPGNPKPGQKYPLVIFLHGAGERGNDNNVQLVHGVKEFANAQAREKFPCFLIAPQCPTGKRWVEVDWSAKQHDMPPKPSEPLNWLLALLEQMKKEKPIDTDRIYVTGLSMGGYGTWDLLSRHAEMFAAAVPVCGGGDEAKASVMKGVPIWVFHGAKDTAVIPERSRNMVAAVKKAEGNIKYTEYPEVGHDSWNKAYADPELLPWMFGQKLKSR